MKSTQEKIAHTRAVKKKAAQARKSKPREAAAAVPLKAPFPYFGGKSRVADLVWRRFGDPQNYCEPFFGSGAMLLKRPTPGRIETVNDADGYLVNFWRAVKWSPEETASWADWPVTEMDLHARHEWLVEAMLPAGATGVTLRESLRRDPAWHDPKIAGWWVWGMSCWIGSGWCASAGDEDGFKSEHRRPRLGAHAETGVTKSQNKRPVMQKVGNGVHSSQPPTLTGSDRGVNSQSAGRSRDGHTWNQRPQLSDSCGVHADSAGERRPHLIKSTGTQSRTGMRGQGRPQLVHHGEGVNHAGALIADWFLALQARLRRVRVCYGDFARILTPAVTTYNGLTAVFLDPPYPKEAGRAEKLYGQDCLEVAHRAAAWAVAQGEDPKLRIAFCGYEGSHEFPASWECVPWTAQGGYSNRSGSGNRHRERIWFSPHCLRPEDNPQGVLF